MLTATEEAQRILARNRLALTVSAGMGYLGFTLSMAFLPMYIKELGVVDNRAIAIWTGFCFGITPLVAAIISPFWGRMMVRFGNKMMLERALGSFVIIMAITAHIHDVRLLFLLRTLQGIFGGYAALIFSMVASSSPVEEIGKHIGLLQSVQTFSMAVGPLIGSLISSVIGLRNTFYVTSAIFAFNLIYVYFGYQEVRGRDAPPRQQKEEAAHTWDILKVPAILQIFIVIFLVQYIDRSFAPVIPLYVATLLGYGKAAALISGVLLTGGSLAAAVSAIWWGRQSLRIGARSLMITSTIAGTLVSLAMALPASVLAFGFLRVILGLVAGGSMTLAYSWGGYIFPGRIRTTAFTLLSSASLYAISISPLVSGLLMSLGIRFVFILNGIFYASVLGFLLRLRKQNASEDD